MSSVRGPIGVACLFCATIGRRLLLCFVGRAPAEATDADGNFRTLVVTRPPPENPLEQADFAAVHQDMLVRREIPGFNSMIAPILVLILMLLLCGWFLFIGGLRALPFMLFPLSIGVFALAARWWTNKHTLQSAENNIAAAWLRQGCCPHCAYRFPSPGNEAVARCSECGVRWRRPLSQASSAPT